MSHQIIHDDLVATTLTRLKKDKVFQCEHPGCDKKFNRNFSLKVHTVSHSGIKAYACNFEGCFRRFTTGGNLSRHRSKHSKDRPYVCTIPKCSKGFCTREKLSRHIKTHAKLRPFTCKYPDCYKKFTTSGNFGRHIKVFHSNLSMVSCPRCQTFSLEGTHVCTSASLLQGMLNPSFIPPSNLLLDNVPKSLNFPLLIEKNNTNNIERDIFLTSKTLTEMKNNHVIQLSDVNFFNHLNVPLEEPMCLKSIFSRSGLTPKQSIFYDS